jgi:two-component system sensor histidine kinase KdpD
VTRLVIGKPRRRRWQRILAGSIVDSLVEGSGEIEVHVSGGEREAEAAPAWWARPAPAVDWRGYLQAVGAVALATAIAWVIFPVSELSNLVMLYLMAIVAVAMRHGRGPSVAASLLSVAALDLFFVPPYLTFAVSDVRFALTFVVMLVVGLVIGTLTVRVRTQADAARQRELRTAALYAMSRELASTRGVADLVGVVVRHLREVFRSDVLVLLPGGDGGLVTQAAAGDLRLDATEMGVARWVYEHRRPAGLGTATLPGARALYLPLVAPRGPVGVLGVRPADPGDLRSPDQQHHLETFANQAALAIDRTSLADEARAAAIREETERLRSSLLSSVSHDLRTPLAGITGAVSTVLDNDAQLDAATRRELLESARAEADRLNRLVQNLLEITRLQSGAVELRREWQSMEEVVGAALAHLAARMAGRPVDVRVPPDLPLVEMDAVLVEQVLINLLDNALKYTPPGSPITVQVTSTDRAMIVEVADRGPGLPRGQEERVFEKFYRGTPEAGRGAGLGLAICKAIVDAHGGRTWAHNLPEGGVAFFFTLPRAATPADA